MLDFKEKYQIINQYIIDNFSFNQESFEKKFSISLDHELQEVRNENTGIIEYEFFFFSLEHYVDYNTILLTKIKNSILNKNKFLAIQTLTKEQRITFNLLKETTKERQFVHHELSVDPVIDFANKCIIENNTELLHILMFNHYTYFKKLLNFGINEDQIDILLNFINNYKNIENF